MLAENIRTIRTQKGYSQETLAQQLGVVRQTVSKWEKGLSVPDADLLARMAELWELPVSALLGGEIPPQREELSDIAQQLAVLNEQMALESRRRRRMRKAVLGTLAALPLLFFLYLMLLVGFRTVQAGPFSSAELSCELEGEHYHYGVIYDDQFRVVAAGGHAFIADHVNTEQYGDANVLIAQIEDYFLLRGGSCEVSYTYDVEY